MRDAINNSGDEVTSCLERKHFAFVMSDATFTSAMPLARWSVPGKMDRDFEFDTDHKTLITNLMEYATFREWLDKRACRFDTQLEGRGEGHGTVTIHRQGRTAELPLVGSRHELDPTSVQTVCEGLGLEWSDLPGPKSRV